MVSSTARVSCRLVFGILILLAAFYIGRPLYWKLSATIQEIRENKTTVKQGISQFVQDAQRSIGWIRDESNSGFNEDRRGRKVGVATARRILRFVGTELKSLN
ncbi:hypothetical protein BVC80_1395g113 [Macleaya cordata]|uniref:Uncharacterized protein n=1 Tax=Macleaya cordata TaxID=56857 RepID=A0A200Q1R4_MACCD|nr:hypothetical protein BVC80_1395g113 [Macleaya cordata]